MDLLDRLVLCWTIKGSDWSPGQESLHTGHKLSIVLLKCAWCGRVGEHAMGRGCGVPCPAIAHRFTDPWSKSLLQQAHRQVLSCIEISGECQDKVALADGGGHGGKKSSRNRRYALSGTPVSQ